jgi:hypothetical protein
LVASGIFFRSEEMLKSIDAQGGSAEAVVVAVAVADSKVSVLFFLQLCEKRRAREVGRETCAKAATV